MLRRRLFTFCSALSLLLCVTAVCEWALNRRDMHGLVLGGPNVQGMAFFRPLGLYLAVLPYWRPPSPDDYK